MACWSALRSTTCKLFRKGLVEHSFQSSSRIQNAWPRLMWRPPHSLIELDHCSRTKPLGQMKQFHVCGPGPVNMGIRHAAHRASIVSPKSYLTGGHQQLGHARHPLRQMARPAPCQYRPRLPSEFQERQYSSNGEVFHHMDPGQAHRARIPHMAYQQQQARAQAVAIPAPRPQAQPYSWAEQPNHWPREASRDPRNPFGPPPGPSNGNFYQQPLNGEHGLNGVAPGTFPRSPSLPQFSAEPLFSVEGVVKTITMHNTQTGYIVARIKPRTHVPSSKLAARGMVTVVGNHKEMAIGQHVLIDGRWVVHKKYGSQLQIERIAGHELSPKEKAVNMLRGAALPGVGPATAERIADHFGSDLEDVMNASNAAVRLSQVHKIGPKTAKRIKEAWDSTRGERETARFIQSLGLQGILVQRIMKRYGTSAKEKITKDPYYALRGITGIDLRKTENVAVQLNLEGHESWPSRAVMAMNDVLLESSRKYGHSFLPWSQLKDQTLQHLQSSGMLWKGGDLTFCGEKAVKWRSMVVETGPLDASCIGKNQASPAQACKKVAKSLREYLKTRLKQVGDVRAEILVSTFGTDIFEILSGDKAVKELMTVVRLEAVAKDIKQSWDRNQFKRPAWVSPVPNLRLLPKSEREETTDAKDFELEVPHVDILPTSRCFHPDMHAAEETISRELARLAAAPPKIVRHNISQWIKKNEAGGGFELSDGQREAVVVASQAPILILTGGPGCGKTYATAAIVKLWLALRREVKLAAPTGRASQRLQEMTKQPSSTIHRLLKYVTASGARKDPSLVDEEEDLEGSYTFNCDNPLEADSVLIDEAAMLDVTLAAALLTALKAGTQLVLVGDVDQLAPVGPGTVLTAAIQSGMIPVIDLREIFRQAKQSKIVTAAHDIQKGLFPQLSILPPDMLQAPTNFDLESDANWVRADRADGPAMQEMVKDVITNVILPRGFDPNQDVQVLSPMRKGTLGVEPLNQQLQQLLNPPASSKPEITKKKSADSALFRLGDRVIQTQNNYKSHVFNGDLGFVRNVDPVTRSLIVEYAETDHQKLLEGVRTKMIEYPAASLWELDLAWATTVHKAQGGESPIVILMLHHGHRNLLTRRLLYTAVTRAKQLVIVVGQEGAIRKAVEEIYGDVRLSSLCERLQVHAMAKGVKAQSPKLFGSPATGLAPIDITASSTQSLQQMAEQKPILEATAQAIDAASGTTSASDTEQEQHEVPQPLSSAVVINGQLQSQAIADAVHSTRQKQAEYAARMTEKERARDLHKGTGRRTAQKTDPQLTPSAQNGAATVQAFRDPHRTTSAHPAGSFPSSPVFNQPPESDAHSPSNFPGQLSPAQFQDPEQPQFMKIPQNFPRSGHEQGAHPSQQNSQVNSRPPPKPEPRNPHLRQRQRMLHGGRR